MVSRFPNPYLILYIISKNYPQFFLTQKKIRIFAWSNPAVILMPDFQGALSTHQIVASGKLKITP
jgi:hypothetical protein